MSSEVTTETVPAQQVPLTRTQVTMATIGGAMGPPRPAPSGSSCGPSPGAADVV